MHSSYDCWQVTIIIDTLGCVVKGGGTSRLGVINQALHFVFNILEVMIKLHLRQSLRHVRILL